MIEVTKKKKKQKYIWFGIALLVLFCINLVNAEQQTLGTFKQNDCINLIQTCNNCTYSNITSVIYPNSSVVISNVEMTKSGTYFYYFFCNTSLNGAYIVTGVGDLDGTNEIWNYDFTITPNGEDASVGKAIFYIGLIIILIVFIIGCVSMFMETNNLLAKVATVGLGYLILIAINFIAWNMAKDFLTSSPFLIDMFRILFFVLIVGLFPLLIGAFAWYFLMLWKIKEIENLMKHGMSEQEASERVNRRRR